MRKHISPSKTMLSFTAIVLLMSICLSCTSPDTGSLPDSAPPQSSTTIVSSASTSADISTTATASTPTTTAPAPTVDPEEDKVIEMLQAVMAATPRDADYISVYDLTADRLLYTTGETQKIYPASTTKLISILYALTIANEDDIFTVGKEINIAPYDSSKAWISIDQTFTVRDLVAAMLLPSGNDAAYTLAVGCGRMKANDNSLSAEKALKVFMDGLNQYCADKGLSGSHFVTPDGYHDPDHYTTMQDMAMIADMAYENELMKEIMAMPTYTAQPLNFGDEITWHNTNLLLAEGSDYHFEGTTGMKTGYHSDAGACLIATAERDGRTLLVLLFKGSDKMGRFSEATSVLRMCFAMLEA